MKRELNNSSDIKEKKEYLRRLERRLDDLAVVQERAQKEVKKVQKEIGVNDPEMMGWEPVVGIFLLVAAAGSFSYALIRDPIITGNAVGVSAGSPSVILSLTFLLFVIFLVLPRKK